MSLTSQIIFNKANLFFSESKCSSTQSDNFIEFSIGIPIIQQICTFDVNAIFLIEKLSQKNLHIYKFEIISKKLKINKSDYFKFFFYHKTNLKLSIKNINKFINNIKKILPKLYFNKFTGKFELKTEFINCINKLNPQINQINLTNTNNILGFDIFGQEYSNCGECCVCYEKTLIKTSCDHFLCVECWTKIKNINECPYCRCKKIKVLSIV
jgi:hypothetical protein